MPTTTNRGARTSGAAKLFMVVPAPELLKRRRRRCEIIRDAAGVPQGAQDHFARNQANWALPGSPAPSEPAPFGPAAGRRPAWALAFQTARSAHRRLRP